MSLKTLKSIISLIFADEKKGHLIVELMEICNDNPEYTDFINTKTSRKNKKSNYLNELYEYQQHGGDIKIKIAADMEKEQVTQ